jgi:hypothetical protein
MVRQMRLSWMMMRMTLKIILMRVITIILPMNATMDKWSHQSRLAL